MHCFFARKPPRGITLIEVMVAIFISSILTLVIGASIEYLFGSQRVFDARFGIFELRSYLVSVIHDRGNWSEIARTVPELRCTRTHTCPAGVYQSFQALDVSSITTPRLVTMLASTTGFKEDGAPCSGFNLLTPNPACPFRFLLEWKLICKGVSDCSSSRVEVRGTVQGGTANLSGTALNPFAFTALPPDLKDRCPSVLTDYVRVPPTVESALGYSLCVARYEMKVSQLDNTPILDGRGSAPLAVALHKPVSRPQGTPWTRLSLTQALTVCRSLGPEHRLIHNSEWNLLANDIAASPENWSNGRINSGNSDNSVDLGLNGIAWYTGSNALASDGSDPYYATDNTAAQAFGSGGEQKRTHAFSNGEIVWDMAGNVRERVDVDGLGGSLSYTGGAGGYFDLNSGTITGFTATSTNSVAFPTSTFYPINAAWTHASQNIGGFSILGGGQIARVLTRGADFNPASWPGIFAGSVDESTSDTSDLSGFRCVYQF